MPILAALLISMARGFAELFGKVLGQKAAIVGALIATLSVLILGMFAAVTAIIGTFSAVFPNSGYMAVGVWLAFPPPIPQAITAMLSVDAAIAVYKWNVMNLKIIATATNV